MITNILGWAGSALLLVSVAQSNTRRLRLLNLGACVVLTVYNWALGAVPAIVMNLALCVINIWRLRGDAQTPAAPAAPPR